MESKESSTEAITKQKMRVWTRNMFRFRPTVELICFLYTMGDMLQKILIPDMYLNTVCRVNFNMSDEHCNNRNHTLDDDRLLVDTVQSYVSTLNIYGSLIKTIPSIFFVLFLGPWSDKHGRKPLMIIPLIGCILSTGISTLIFYVGTKLPAEYLLFAELPVSFLGGESTLNLAYLSYLADVSSEETRTMRVSLLSGASVFARPFGGLLSKYLLENTGPVGIWSATLAFYACAILWTVFFIKDSRGSALETNAALPSNESGGESVLKNLWRSFAVTFKPRSGYKRSCLAILLGMRCISIFSDDPFGMNYLYSRKKFGFTAEDFALFRTANCASLAFGAFVLLPILSNCLKINDILLGIISLLGDITTCVMLILATSSLMFYLATLTIVMGMGIVTVMNALPSKLVPTDELGNVYAVLACAESILPLIASPAINLIYANTVDFFPGCVYVLGMSLDVVLIVLFTVVILLQRKGERSISSSTACIKNVID